MEFDYLEETRTLKAQESSSDWARCIISQTKPTYEDAKKRASKKGKELTKSQYNKACKELGFA